MNGGAPHSIEDGARVEKPANGKFGRAAVPDTGSTRPAQAEDDGPPARLWRILTRSRGNRLWDGVIRGSGLLAALGILLVELVPETAPLVGFSVFTIWMTGPLSPLFPTGYEPVLMVMSRAYAPLLVAAVGMATQIYVEFLNYHLHGRLLELDSAEPLRESRVVEKMKGYFERHPFFTVWFCAWSPVPYWTVRVLAPLAGYPLGRYMAATVLGRFPKLWIFAALGLYWRAPGDALLLAVAGGSMALGIAAWAVRRARDDGGRETPAAWRTAPSPDDVSTETDGWTAPPESSRQPGEDEPVKVLYVAGIGRSGSTLLARALGGVDGLTAVGETMHFFGRGLINNELCGCGRPVRECHLWGRVSRRLEEGLWPLPASSLERLRQRATEGRHIPALFLPVGTPGFEEKLGSYRRHLSRLYREIRQAADGRVIVDSSKNAGYARILRDTPGVELHILHLVRDSRGVAHSLGKRRERPGVLWSGGRELLDRRSPGLAAGLWMVAQLLVESLASGASSYLRLRYRDLVRRPSETLRLALRNVGEFTGRKQLSHVSDRGALRIGRQHVLAGNPMREQQGEIVLEEDVEWRRGLGTAARGVVTSLTLPLLFRYGYVSSEPYERSDRGAAASSVAALTAPAGDAE